MPLVEVQLNSLPHTGFRKLTYSEGFALNTKKGDFRKSVLATAMVEVSGLPIIPAQATESLPPFSQPVLKRIWVCSTRQASPPSGFSPQKVCTRLRNSTNSRRNMTTARSAAPGLPIGRLKPWNDNLVRKMSRSSGARTPIDRSARNNCGILG